MNDVHLETEGGGGGRTSKNIYNIKLPANSNNL